MKVRLFEIFKIYFLIGIQLLGGGYVILPLLQKYLSDERNWIEKEKLVDYLALSQCLPGIIALNISIFSGYTLRKIKGAITAVLGLILPSFLIIILIANLILNVAENKYLQDAFFGVRLSIIVLIFYMIKDIFKTSIKTFFSFGLFIFVVLSSVFLKLSPSSLVLISILIVFWHNKKEKQK